MKIAAIGSGHIGGTLGKAWAAAGHQVMFGARDPHKASIQVLLQEAGPNASVGTVHEAFAFGDVILLAVLPDAVEEVLTLAGDLHGKVLIDSTNRFDSQSAGEIVIRLAQNARVVKAFNSVAWEVLANPQYGETNASLFIAGEDADAKSIVSQLCRDMGLDPIDAGGVEAIRFLETAFGPFWQRLVPQFGRDYSLRVLRRDEK